jgi:ribosomal protein S14
MNGEWGNCVECGKDVFFTRTGKMCRTCFFEIWEKIE